MSGRCELSDLPVSQCGCRLHGPEPEPRKPDNRVQAAAYETTCPECREPIEIGDTIAPSRIEGGLWVHEECA